jgi:ferredoxin
MPTHTVKFLPYDMVVQIEDGGTVIRGALEAGVHVNASCGGEGVCGKCRVLIEEGSVDGGVS